MAGFFQDFIPKGISTGLQKLSTLGLVYSDEIIKQSKAVGVTQYAAGTPNLPKGLEQALSLADIGVYNQFIPIFDTSYPSRRDFLRKFSVNGEISWILDTVANETIVYDDMNYFAHPIYNFSDMGLTDEKREEIEKSLEINFNRIYNAFGFRRGNLAWRYFRQFLVEGFLAFEIIWDKTERQIIELKEIDPASLQPELRTVDGEIIRFWVQYPDSKQWTRELPDSCVIFIAYAKANDFSRISYTESLVRSHNLLRLMEDTRASWNVTNSTFRMKFVFPTGDVNSIKERESLNEMIMRFKEDIQLNSESGELQINGKPGLMYYKNYVMPQRDGDSPDIEILSPDGPDMNDVDIVNYFYDKLKLDSKIPFTRYLRDGSASYSSSADGVDREEIRFSRFIDQLRVIYEDILIKPLTLQMLRDHPELQNNAEFYSGMGLKWVEYGYFSELKEMEILESRSNFIETLGGMMDSTGDNPMFSKKWLMTKYLGMTLSEYEENERLLKEELDAKKAEENMM